jgi:N utilization substance protein B
MQKKPAIKKIKSSANARKSAARLAAVQVLYQMRLNNQDAKTVLKEFISHRSGATIDGATFVAADEEMLNGIVTGVQKRWSDIDGILTKALADGGRDRVEILLECIIRAGIFELLEHGSIDTGIIINDYLNVTTGFYEGAEKKIVNAVLDKVGKTVRE